jgi:hypothetical protein
MFIWGQSLYSALRASFYGAFLGFLISLIITLSGGKSISPGDAIGGAATFFWLFGLARLGWDLFSKKYPDA